MCGVLRAGYWAHARSWCFPYPAVRSRILLRGACLDPVKQFLTIASCPVEEDAVWMGEGHLPAVM